MQGLMSVSYTHLLLDIERDRINGAKYYSVDEVDAELRRAIAEASGHGRAEV